MSKKRLAIVSIVSAIAGVIAFGWVLFLYWLAGTSLTERGEPLAFAFGTSSMAGIAAVIVVATFPGWREL